MLLHLLFLANAIVHIFPVQMQQFLRWGIPQGAISLVLVLAADEHRSLLPATADSIAELTGSQEPKYFFKCTHAVIGPPFPVMEIAIIRPVTSPPGHNVLQKNGLIEAVLLGHMSICPNSD